MFARWLSFTSEEKHVGNVGNRSSRIVLSIAVDSHIYKSFRTCVMQVAFPYICVCECVCIATIGTIALYEKWRY